MSGAAEVSSFVKFGGRIAEFKHNWETITNDQTFLKMIDGVTLELHQFPVQKVITPQYKFEAEELKLMSEEVERFLSVGIIEVSEHEPGEIVSNIFCRRKKSGKIRLIGNFKDLNSEIVYHKFKQATIQDILDMIRPGCFMCSIDLRDAYYCIKVQQDCRKFLKFMWNGQLYQFTCLGQGIASAPRIFTKIMKVPIAVLRESGVIIIVYIDDILIIADTWLRCKNDTLWAVELLQKLGYVVNFTKSVLDPTQNIEHLGLNIDSINMTAKITEEKCAHFVDIGNKLLSIKKPTIREVARVLGTMVSYLPGVELGKMHYRALENCKKLALHNSKGNFDQKMALDNGAIADVFWWVENIRGQCTLLSRTRPQFVISTDASKLMWGAVMGDAKTGGSWTVEEQDYHINVQEMMGSLFGLRALCSHLSDTHIRIKTDSKTGACYINNKGGSKSEACNKVALQIWRWCLEKNIYVSAEHVKGTLNNEADFLSRNQDNSGEWSLLNSVFRDIIDSFKVTPTIDLFANRNNCKVNRFISWQPDPFALCFDTFLQYVDNEIFWAFPPFNLITKFLRKVQLEELEGVLVVPSWSTQPFFSLLINLLIDVPIIIRWRDNLLSHPQLPVHPLGKRLKLMACHLSGKSCKTGAFRHKLSTSLVGAGHNHHTNNTKLTLKSGWIFVNDTKLTKLHRV